MILFRQAITVSLVAGVLVGAGCAVAASPGSAFLTGSIVGLVSDSSGVPQMGATVLLVNRYEKIVQRALTNEKGAFGFESLVPDLYSVRVTLASFVPAVKRNIAVQPGVRSFLSISLASIFSSIELVHSAPGQAAIMSEDWKWVLRSSLSTRPILRFTPGFDPAPESRQSRQTVFSQTRGLVRISASDLSPLSAAAGEPDLGTAFAVATSVFGSSQLEVSGNFGYAAAAGIPAAGFRTSFTPEIGGQAGPEVRLTMRQVFLPQRTGLAFVGRQASGHPGLRSLSFGIAERKKLTDNLDLDYGATLESVSFLDRLNYFSPFARLSYNAGKAGALDVGFSSGAPPVEVLARNRDGEFQGGFAALSAFPRVSRRGGSVRILREQNIEIAYRRAVGKTVFTVGGYHERMSNAALTLNHATGLYSNEELLPDLFSDAANFNIGDFRRLGYAAQVSQSLSDHLSASLAVGSTNVVTTSSRQLATADPEELRSFLQRGRRYWASAKITAATPRTGTKLSSSYQWTDYAAVLPGHRYLTENFGSDPGLNFQFRQPIGGVPGVGRIEATAELRNVLAQGYLTLTTPGGRRIVVVQAPRSVRGGFSLIF